MVQYLAGMRLLVIEHGVENEDHVVELVHDSLIDRWPTLARWLAEHQDDAAFLARLRSAAQEWAKSDRDEGLLWRGAPAHEARIWYRHYNGVLPRREQDYLHAVLALDRRTTRRRRLLVTGTITAVLVVAFVWAWTQAALTLELSQTVERERKQIQALVRARTEAELARQDAEIEAARAQQALAAAEQARDEARAAAARASAEKAKADRAAREARRAQAMAQEAEARTPAEKDVPDQTGRDLRRDP